MDYYTGIFPRLADSAKYFITPHNGGRQCIRSDKYLWNNNKHQKEGEDKYFFQYTLSGKGVFEVAGEKTILESGMAFVCVSTRPYLYYFEKGLSTHWEFVWLNLKGLWGQRIFEFIQEKYGPVFNLDKDSLSIRMLFNLFDRSRRREGLNAQALSIAGYSFILQLLQDIQCKGHYKKSIKVDQVQSYLHDHWNNPITVKSLSELVGFSKEYVSSIFKKKYGVPPGRYLLNIKLDNARVMLESTDLSLDKIAQTCGLSDASYLCRIFRQHYGISPAQYRK